ncbi:hypothetical protein FQZ97_1092010 [compost metagenome]
MDVGDADECGGALLLRSPEGDDFRPVGGVKASRVAVGHDAVGDLDARGGPGRHGAGDAKVNVVWMGRETEHPLDPVRVRVERALRHSLCGQGISPCAS